MLNPYQRNEIYEQINKRFGRPFEKKRPEDKPNIVLCFESVMGSDYRIKKSGRAMLALCPFHGESNPSFAMYEDTNSYWCFTCGEKGDSYSFLMKQLNCDFPAAKQYAIDNSLFENI